MYVTMVGISTSSMTMPTPIPNHRMSEAPAARPSIAIDSLPEAIRAYALAAREADELVLCVRAVHRTRELRRPLDPFAIPRLSEPDPKRGKPKHRKNKE